MHRIHSCGLTLAAVLALPGAVHGEPVAVHTTGALPFSSAELDAALALRSPGGRAARSARQLEAGVAAVGDSVRVEVAGRERTVALEGQQGADAARIVAFAILDLAGDQLDPPASLDVAAVAPTPRPRGRTGAWSLAAWGVAGSRSEAMLELGLPLTRRTRIVGAAGLGLATQTTVMARSVTVRAAPIRLGVAVRIPTTPLELRAGALVLVERASADRSATNAGLGAGGALVGRMPIASRIALVAGAGADGFATAFDYQVDRRSVATTSRLAWWVGGGIEVSP